MKATRPIERDARDDGCCACTRTKRALSKSVAHAVMRCHHFHKRLWVRVRCTRCWNARNRERKPRVAQHCCDVQRKVRSEHRARHKGLGGLPCICAASLFSQVDARQWTDCHALKALKRLDTVIALSAQWPQCIEVITMRICAGQQLSRAGSPFAVSMQCMLFTHQFATARLFQFLESFACHTVAPHLSQRRVPSSDLHPSAMP
jgi:hypothetical protein